MRNHIKRKGELFRAKFRESYASLMTGEATLDRGDSITIIASILAAIMFFASGHAFAEGLIDTVGDIADETYKEFATNLSKVAGLAAGVCIIWFLICTNDEDAKRPLKWGKRILVGYIVFMILGAIFRFIDTKTSGMGL